MVVATTPSLPLLVAAVVVEVGEGRSDQSHMTGIAIPEIEFPLRESIPLTEDREDMEGTGEVVEEGGMQVAGVEVRGTRGDMGRGTRGLVVVEEGGLLRLGRTTMVCPCLLLQFGYSPATLHAHCRVGTAWNN